MHPVHEQCLKALVSSNCQGIGTVNPIILVHQPELPEEFVEAYRLHSTKNIAQEDDPYRNAIHVAQYKFIGRDIQLFCNPDSVVKKLAHIEVNKTRYEKLVNKARTNFERRVVISFYSHTKQFYWWTIYRNLINPMSPGKAVELIWHIANLIQDAMGPTSTLPTQYRTSDVMGLIKAMRKTEDWCFPQLADALQEAGYDNEDLLAHYRDPNARFSLASWIFKATGQMEYTNALGRNSRQTSDEESTSGS